MRRPIQIRRGTAAEWTAANPILRPGELGLETDTGRIKAVLGRAGVAWNSIRGYVNRAESRNRYAAKSLGGSSSTAGAFASFTWDPGQDVTVSFVYASAVAPSATVTLFGAGVANTWNVRFLTTGEIEFRETSNQRAITAAGVAKYDGYSHVVSLRVTGTTVAITHDGVAVGSGTFSSFTWASATYFIGAGAATSSQRWPGTLHNLEGTDHGTAANGFTFLMDEPPTSATFVNTLSGTSVGNASKNTGTNGQSYPWVTSVASTDGRGMPFQGVWPLVYSAFGSADLTGVSTNQDVTTYFNTEVMDPTGSLTNGVFTAPAAGTVRPTWCGSLTETAAAADDVAVGFKLGAALGDRYTWIGLTASQSKAPFCFAGHPIAVVAGETVTPNISGLSTATVTIEDRGRVMYEFTPTPTTG